MRRSSRICGLPDWGRKFSRRAYPVHAVVAPIVHRATRTELSFEVAGATTRSRGVSPAAEMSAAGARSHNPKHGLRSQGRAILNARRSCRAKVLLQFYAQRLGTAGQAGDIVADVCHNGRARRETEHCVEGCHAMNLRRRQVQAQGHVVQCTGANPSNPGIESRAGREGAGRGGLRYRRRRGRLAPSAGRLPSRSAVGQVHPRRQPSPRSSVGHQSGAGPLSALGIYRSGWPLL